MATDNTTTISKKLQKQLADIEYSNCILVELQNCEEEEKFHTVFIAWLQKKDASRLSDIIQEETEVMIYWPVIDDINANSVDMKKKLKECEFETRVLQVLAAGSRFYIELHTKIFTPVAIFNNLHAFCHW